MCFVKFTILDSIDFFFFFLAGAEISHSDACVLMFGTRNPEWVPKPDGNGTSTESWGYFCIPLKKNNTLISLFFSQNYALWRNHIDHNISKRCRISDLRNMGSRKIDLKALLLLPFGSPEGPGEKHFHPWYEQDSQCSMDSTFG